MHHHLRLIRSLAPIAVAITMLTSACGGDSDDLGAGGADEAAGSDSSIRSGTCDPIRGAGTLTNLAGEPAAFVVTVAYHYTGEDLPMFQRDATPVLADGEEYEFSIGPDPTRGSPSSCEIIGAERVEADEAAIADVEEREAAAPDAETTTASIEPLWSVSGIGGSVRAVAADGEIGYLASTLQGGGAIFAIDLATGDLIWEVESDVAFELLEPDSEGGVLASSGPLLVSFDDTGTERWESTPLRRTEGVAAGSIERIATEDATVIVGGSAPSGAAGLDLASGERTWYLGADDRLTGNEIGFGGAGDLIAVTDHGVLVAGGVPDGRHLALLDTDTGEPTMVWTVPDAGRNASTDGTVVVDASGTSVTAWDVATGDERWSVSNEEWDGSSASSAPAIVGDVVIVHRPAETTAYDLVSGNQRWQDLTMPPLWIAVGVDVRIEDRVFGHVSLADYGLLGADGGLSEITVDSDVTGTLSGAAAGDDGRVLLAARGSTAAQGSTAWVLDLDDL